MRCVSKYVHIRILVPFYFIFPIFFNYHTKVIIIVSFVPIINLLEVREGEQQNSEERNSV